MLETIERINSAVNGFVWGIPAMVCIIGVGLYLTIRTHFIQFRKFGYTFKVTLGKLFHKKGAAEGAVTPFQAVCTALASTVGTGNIAGVAGAIALGGPGRSVLDVVLGPARHVYEVFRSDHGCAFSVKRTQGRLGRRSHVLY